MTSGACIEANEAYCVLRLRPKHLGKRGTDGFRVKVSRRVAMLANPSVTIRARSWPKNLCDLDPNRINNDSKHCKPSQVLTKVLRLERAHLAEPMWQL